LAVATIKSIDTNCKTRASWGWTCGPDGAADGAADGGGLSDPLTSYPFCRRPLCWLCFHFNHNCVQLLLLLPHFPSPFRARNKGCESGSKLVGSTSSCCRYPLGYILLLFVCLCFFYGFSRATFTWCLSCGLCPFRFCPFPATIFRMNSGHVCVRLCICVPMRVSARTSCPELATIAHNIN